MKRFKVVCIGYEKPSKEKIEELLRFEESWLEREKLGRKILIHPGVCIKETSVYNQSVLDDLKKRNMQNIIFPSQIWTQNIILMPDLNITLQFNFHPVTLQAWAVQSPAGFPGKIRIF